MVFFLAHNFINQIFFGHLLHTTSYAVESTAHIWS